jgi:hypothetical protein
MDIFTTFLTRVVPVPIKPANLKVKALLKEAGTSKLKEDPDHLENHDYYVIKKQADNDANDENEQESKSADQKSESTDEKAVEMTNEESAAGSIDEKSTKSKDGVKHLDLYV